MTNTNVELKTAIVSVYDKSGLTEFCRQLTGMGIHILTTGGTARVLADAAIPAEEVSRYTGFPEMMDGRVKTLHPRIHGGLLGRLQPDGTGQDAAVMATHGIRPIDLLVTNLYPFTETIARPGVLLAEAIENIDIGGPAMLRSGSKNFSRVTVVVDPTDYPAVIDELTAHGGCLGLATRYRLAVKAFRHVADYDIAIADYLGGLKV